MEHVDRRHQRKKQDGESVGQENDCKRERNHSFPEVPLEVPLCDALLRGEGDAEMAIRVFRRDAAARRAIDETEF